MRFNTSAASTSDTPTCAERFLLGSPPVEIKPHGDQRAKPLILFCKLAGPITGTFIPN